MQNHYHDVESPETESSVGNQAFMDLTDRQNDEFVYLYWENQTRLPFYELDKAVMELRMNKTS